MSWISTSCGEEAPRARAGHSLTSIPGRRFILFGGYDNVRNYNDLYLLEQKATKYAWTPLKQKGNPFHMSSSGAWSFDLSYTLSVLPLECVHMNRRAAIASARTYGVCHRIAFVAVVRRIRWTDFLQRSLLSYRR